MTRAFVISGLVLAALGITAQAALADTAGLTGASRTEFVNASIASCTSTAAQKNPTVAREVIVRYCVCYSNRMANSIKPSELPMLASLSNNPVKLEAMLRSRVQAAGQACAPKSK